MLLAVGVYNYKTYINLRTNVALSQDYQDFFTKSYLENNKKIILTTENINDELNKSTNNKIFIVGDNGYLSKEAIEKHFVNKNIKLESTLRLGNLL
ncbi:MULTISPECIES: hypothetical protein [unclassified Gemella]|uniref:hypothetical protein n=1 Tax=unclassified Gemella TaxID=2624949 RepID=UPI0015CF9367|nr:MULTISPECIES: hypothetical protein [unclassified Gemella]